MPSHSFTMWDDRRRAMLDELEAAHQAIGGTAPGRRYATQQLNQSYAVMLSSQFQAFSRDIHTEAADTIANSHPTPIIAGITRASLLHGRQLDRGNASPSSLGADFNRLGFAFWNTMAASAPVLIPRARDRLEELNVWRNAIAHQDFTGTEFQRRFSGRHTLQIPEVRRWRRSCERLAIRMDVVLADHIQQLLGTLPW